MKIEIQFLTVFLHINFFIRRRRVEFIIYAVVTDFIRCPVAAQIVPLISDQTRGVLAADGVILDKQRRRIAVEQLDHLSSLRIRPQLIGAEVEGQSVRVKREGVGIAFVVILGDVYVIVSKRFVPFQKRHIGVQLTESGKQQFIQHLLVFDHIRQPDLLPCHGVNIPGGIDPGAMRAAHITVPFARYADRLFIGSFYRGLNRLDIKTGSAVPHEFMRFFIHLIRKRLGEVNGLGGVFVERLRQLGINPRRLLGAMNRRAIALQIATGSTL